jgi:hypothetical protein
MAVTYNLVIDSDLPPEYDKLIINIEKNLATAKQKYEDLIDFINLNQGSQYDLFNFSPKFYETIEHRFRITNNYNKPHIFTRYGNNIIVQTDRDCVPEKINLLDKNCYEALLTNIKNTLLEFDIHTYGVILGWKIENSDGQVFKDFDALTESFKLVTIN